MFVLAMTSACSHQKPSVARRLEQWFLVRQPELGVATKRLRGQCFADNCPVQIGNDSSDLTRGLKLLRCKLVRMGDVFRGLSVGFSSTPFQTPGEKPLRVAFLMTMRKQAEGVLTKFGSRSRA